ncbi:MAG: EAL and modified HD-GYP domain-containing signal transduction protein [Kiritimatiellia bacterium]|jgi:EAL and modified HD-GYP domain-containing signal transduction protein
MSNLAESAETFSARKDIFIARQPIFDAELNVQAYELLFRDEDTSVANISDGNMASSQVMINAFLGIGIDSISDNRISFINLTRDFIVGRLPLPMTPNAVVIEILEDIVVDDELIAALKDFSSQGFSLALDDYTFTDDKEPLFDIVDIVKIDIMGSDRDTLVEDVRALQKCNVKLLAEKVETREDFELCRSLGFDFYQGYFISRPEIIKGQALKPGRISLLEILSMLEDPNCDVDSLEKLISQDVTISYKILRIINSSFFGFRRKIDSVKQAVVSLGMKAIRDWFVILALTSIDDKPRELIMLTLVRARMMQALAKKKGLNPDPCFTTGLFSSIDAIMDQSMDEVLKELPLSSEIGNALIKREGEVGKLLSLVLNYERGNWAEVTDCGISAEDLSRAYLESMAWATEVM